MVWPLELRAVAPAASALAHRRRPGALGPQLRVLHVSSERDFDTVFATLVQLRPGGLADRAAPATLELVAITRR